MFKQMKLGTKLMVAFLAVGIIPFAIVGTVALNKSSKALTDLAYGQLEGMRSVKKSQIENFFAARKGDMGVLVETVATLRQEAFDKLTAVREVKKAAVERYFQTINDQIITFSEDRMIVDAMRQFKRSFRDFRRDNAYSASDIERMRRELRTYYTGPFSVAYAKQNEGRSPNIDQYFRKLDDDSIAAQYHYIQANINPLGSKHLLDQADDTSSYSKLHGKFHPVIRNFLDKFGYYDIFLVDIESGDIVYSVFKELDFSTSLIDGPNAQTNFAEAFRQAAASTDHDAVVLADYAQYTPSYEAPAGFIASPIFDGNEKIGVAMFQLPIDRLNAIMNERSGLGETGETYLVGPNELMRSDSYLDPKHHSVVASYTNPETGKVSTDATKAGLSGKTGANVIIDYNGNPVLSAYTPVKVGTYTWVLLAEIDVAEAFCPKDQAGSYFFDKYVKMYGYYDLFLVNPDGYCFYTVAKESDYKTNLVNGKFADSGLGKLVRQVLKSNVFGLADFAPYAPSNGEPAAFIAQPVVHDGRTDLVVALQLSLDAINRIMKQRDGMGKTGETYLVGQDKLMRSDSFLDPVNHTVKASFANPQIGSVDTMAARDALAGQSGQRIITDYNGNPVLSAYAPIKVGDTTWALMAEIDEAEAFAAVKTMQMLMAVVALVGIAAIIAVAFLITRSISKPINRIIQGMTEGAEQVASAANQVSSASQQGAEGASEQAASIEETSSSLEEMSSMTRQNADNAAQANQLMNESQKVVDQANAHMQSLTQSMTDISTASQETSKIIKTIDEIAFQTNLLALNAAVEAARAGEAGAGFAVVADEVRNLALRAAQAAKNTAQLIETTVKQIGDGAELVDLTNKAFENVSTSTSKVRGLVAEIAAASSEQAQGIDQVNTAVAQMDKVTQQNAATSEESASASEEMSAQAMQLNQLVVDLATLIGGKSENGHSGRTIATDHGNLAKSSSSKRSSSSPKSKQTLSAKKMIPLDPDDFTDF